MDGEELPIRSNKEFERDRGEYTKIIRLSAMLIMSIHVEKKATCHKGLPCGLSEELTKL